MEGKKPQRKKQKVEIKQFASAEQIRQSLCAQNPDTIVNVNALRNQLTVRPDEAPIAPQDPRLLLVREWLEKSPGGQDMFTLWETSNSKQSTLQVAIVAVFAAILSLLSLHYTYHALGYLIVRTLLTPQWMRRLGSYIGGTHNELILVSLKLLNIISNFAGGREKKTVLEVFQWETKSLPKLLNLRRRGKVDTNPLVLPDIRTLYIQFLLSFLDSPVQTKSAFLEQHSDAFLAIFKGLFQDHYAVVRYVLETIWEGLWADPKIKRTTKFNLFNEQTISHLCKLYDRTDSDGDDPEHIPADLVHHFLLAISTRPGTGICFRDRGWYPREDPDDEKGGKIHNKVLANVLKMLKVNEDSRQQELARRILEACPELVAGFWSGAQLTLEPRLSTKWIANISCFGLIISLPVPENTFFLPGTKLYNPVPPPLITILANILPSDVSPKTIFTKGLQSPSRLVQHYTALALAKCLVKYAKVQEIFRSIGDSLGTTDDGQWSMRGRELEKEIRRRVPEFQVIVAFSQQKSVPTTVQDGSSIVQNTTKNALLQESATRLLMLYHKYLPDIVAEARFDVGKLLSSFPLFDDVEAADYTSMDTTKRLNLAQQLHVLKLLKENDQFAWANKATPSHTYVYVLLRALTRTTVPALKTALNDLLRYILSSSILFQENPTESLLWLLSLPCLLRTPQSTSPDGVELTNEAEGVAAFLDDCIQRCLKTPFRYIEDMHNLLSQSHSEYDVPRADVCPSPLIMTVGEQLDAKMRGNLISPSDILAIVTFIRKLLLRLASYLPDSVFLEVFVKRIDNILAEARLWPSDHPLFTAAVRRELRAMDVTLHPMDPDVPEASTEHVCNYLTTVENLPIGVTQLEQILTSHSIVDGLRFMEQPITLSDVRRLFRVVEAQWKPATSQIVEYLLPRSGLLWQNRVILGTPFAVQNCASFEWVLHVSSAGQVVDLDYQRQFVEAFCSSRPDLQAFQRIFRLIDYRMRRVQPQEQRGMLSLLAILSTEAKSTLTNQDVVTLKEQLFSSTSTVKMLAVSRDINTSLQSGLRELLQSSFDPRAKADRSILTEISSQWFSFLEREIQVPECNNFGNAALWIKYLPPTDVLRLFDLLTEHDPNGSNALFAPLLQSTLIMIQESVGEDPEQEAALRDRIPLLLRMLYQPIHTSLIEDLLLSAINSTLPIGCRHCCELDFDDSVEFCRLTPFAELRWAHRTDRLSYDISLIKLLTSESWSASVLRIICSLFYKQPLPMQDFQAWLKSDKCKAKPAEQLVFVIHAALDVYGHFPSEIMFVDEEAWIASLHCIMTLCFRNVDKALHRLSAHCISLALDHLQQFKDRVIQLLLPSLRECQPTEHLLRVAHQHQHTEMTSVLLYSSLQSLIICFSDNTPLSSEVLQLVKGTNMLIKNTTASALKIHQVETVCSVIIQFHISKPEAIDLANSCLTHTQLKPVVVNRLLQSMLQHPNFRRFSVTSNTNSVSRMNVIRLLHTLFHLHPSNTCQATQIEPLLHIYGGTLSHEDLHLFSIFQLFENHRRMSLAPFFGRWSSAVENLSTSALDALQSCDATLILRTALHFPQWRGISTECPQKITHHDACLYDPVFLLLLLSRILTESQPPTAFGWVELFRSNIICLCVRVLSSRDVDMRELGLSQLALLSRLLQNVDFQEKAPVLYILDLLRNSFPAPTPNTPPARLPSYSTLILAHALRGIFYPSNFIYPLTSRFLLQRPQLDLQDVPMLYSMLYSNSDEWKKERGWIIRFLADGMMSSGDWKILTRRHTWDLLASNFQSFHNDHVLRKGIFEVLANLTCNRQATMSLVLKSGLLAWIELQIKQTHDEDCIKWVRILNNVVLVSDHAKLDVTLKHAWRRCILRGISSILSRSNCEFLLLNASSVIYRLSTPDKSYALDIQNVLELALKTLKAYEKSLPSMDSLTEEGPIDLDAYELCHGYAIHEPPNEKISYQIWTECATMLWRVAMGLDHKTTSWDALTCRLLLCHNFEFSANVEAGWARKEVVHCMHNQFTQ